MSPWNRLQLDRRRFLRQSLAATAGMAFGFPAIVKGQSVWGDIEPDAQIWDGNYQPKKILEILSYGGMSQWENFWVNLDADNNPDWRNFGEAIESSEWFCPPLDTIAGSNTATKKFGVDSLGNEVHWGPATRPLWQPELFDRARMIVLSHELPPHEVAVPYAIAGTGLGNPRHAGAGAAVQRRNQSLSPRAVPYAYCVMPGLGNFGFVRSSAMAIGQHAGNPRPLLIRVGSNTLVENLNRGVVPGDTAAQAELENRDLMLRVYAGKYRDRLRWHGMGDPVRSAGFSAYEGSLDALFQAPALTDLLPDGILDVSATAMCLGHEAPEDPVTNPTATSLNLARQLLTVGDARYVFVADRGMFGSGSAPYDTHSAAVTSPEDHVRRTQSGVFNLLSSLAAQIDPSGSDPTRINLDDTLVLIHTEFGRSPTPENDDEGPNDGRGHWIDGFAGVLLGGPVPPRDPDTQAGERIAGGIDPATSRPPGTGDRFNAVDVRAAVLLAAGIRPFEADLYATSDVSDNLNTGDEVPNMRELKARILGVPS